MNTTLNPSVISVSSSSSTNQFVFYGTTTSSSFIVPTGKRKRNRKQMNVRPFNYLLNADGTFTKVSRRMVIGIFDRQDNLLRIGTLEEYQNYWRDTMTMQEYEARKLLPEVPYSFWIYEPLE